MSSSSAEETGSPQSQAQPESIPLPSTPISPSSHLQIPTHSSPTRKTHASTSSSGSAGSSSVKNTNKSGPQPLSLSPPLPIGSSQLASVAAVAPFAHQSDLPSIAARRANTNNTPGMMKSGGRELLLPIGVRSRSGSGVSSDISASPTSPTRLRNSLDKVLRRDGAMADGISVSPSSAMRLSPVSPRQARFAQNLTERERDNVIHTGEGSSYPPRSPHSIRSRHSAQSLGPPSPSRSAAGMGPSSASPIRSEHFPSHPQSPESKQIMKQSSAASLTPSMAIQPRQTPSKYPFSPQPPQDTQVFVPQISEKTGKPKRKFEGYPSKNRFFLNGRILTGGDTPIPFIMSIILVLGVSGTWFGTTAVWWWHNESPAVAIVGAYMCLVTISSMMATAFRDPGIIPRDLDPEPPYAASSPSDGSPKIPLPREIRIRDGIIRNKYCVTCRTYRSPRASHCKTCDNCVDGCDHHCQWVNNCVGRRNYTSFITFVVVACLTLALVIVTAGIHLFEITRQDHTSFGNALHIAAGSAVVFSIGIVVIWPLLSLLGYHIRLLILNITTIEQLRNNYEKQLAEGPPQPIYNPFSYGKWYRNVAYLLCRPEGFTWIEASAVKMDDRRQINPAAYEDWEMVDHEETMSMPSKA